MLDQLLNIVKQFGQDTVVNNPDVPNNENQNVMADASKTIASGFQNILAGGGFQNILDLFKGNSGGSQQTGASGGIGSLLKNPIVTMMIGYFVSKLISKYKMSPSSANNVANSLIPNALNGLIQKVNDPNDNNSTLDNLIGSLTGGGAQQGGGSQLQDILDSFTGGGNDGSGGSGGLNIQDIIGNLTNNAQNNMQNREGGDGKGGGLLDMIKGFFN